jgi:hypothetical protein
LESTTDDKVASFKELTVFAPLDSPEPDKRLRGSEANAGGVLTSALGAVTK